jgi:hypothetical protein
LSLQTKDLVRLLQRRRTTACGPLENPHSGCLDGRHSAVDLVARPARKPPDSAFLQSCHAAPPRCRVNSARIQNVEVRLTWSGRLDSNQRPPAPKLTSAHPNSRADIGHFPTIYSRPLTCSATHVHAPESTLEHRVSRLARPCRSPWRHHRHRVLRHAAGGFVAADLSTSEIGCAGEPNRPRRPAGQITLACASFPSSMQPDGLRWRPKPRTARKVQRG